MFGGEGQGVAVAGGEERSARLSTAAHHRPDGVDHEFCREGTGGGEDRFAGRQTVGKPFRAQLLALFENGSTAAAVDGAVHSAAAEQCGVGGVDDGVDSLRRDVANQHAHPVREKRFKKIRHVGSGKRSPSGSMPARGEGCASVKGKAPRSTSKALSEGNEKRLAAYLGFCAPPGSRV